MKISSKGEYGLRALFDLTQHYDQSPRRSREIGEAQGVPEDYLNQLLITLRKAGLINSLRGPQGGHILARPPQQITLLEVIRELEGDVSPVAHSVEPNIIDKVLNEIWQKVEDETIKILSAVTLEDLYERHNHKQEQVMYYI
jgi:Rrf2 family cysteine metabolism transcriptional repressor